jgi:hypothetical protein
MRSITRALIFASALTFCLPVLAEDLVVSDLQAFTARMDAVRARCDIDAVVERISPLATISGTGLAQGDSRVYRMTEANVASL